MVTSERHADHETDAVLVGGGQFVVVHTAHILHMDNLEDVVDAKRDFPVGLLGVDDVGAIREIHQDGIAYIMRQIGVVLVGELSPQAAHGNHRSHGDRYLGHAG